MKRRKFLSWAGVGWLGSRPPIVAAALTNLVACSSGGSPAKISTRPDGFLSVGTIEELNKSGQLLVEQSAIGSIAVVQNPTDPQALAAVNPTCTHQGCLVQWKSERKAFVCPCHNSAFAADGKVLEGPATEPLATYTTKLDGTSVLVKGS
ncbi:ubiquinol-cytochrome c reductase iron-sulfur subunit [Myxacorys almedinensis]|uniref:Rieske 2Fe-2S domain-containing protein n=1 Tax=Myxacorys almedinensis A TaxID=2690445 RepID=A0A8J7Z3F1_9CYAN|nr:ubiquinol-cytochrome c reductase iron-sulfur subunit [Myxacorys almedinensis]NDJ19267.1 Rieske 2Fe-2S domain-containing protein [Myxacorys almedinensis A]